MGSAEFTGKDEKLSKPQTETNLNPYPSFTNTEKVWIWRQRLQFEFVGRRESYVTIRHPHMLWSWSTFPQILSQKGYSRDTQSGKKYTHFSCLLRPPLVWRLISGELLSLLRHKDLWGHIRHHTWKMLVLSLFGIITCHNSQQKRLKV